MESSFAALLTFLAARESDSVHELTISNATRGALGEAFARARFAGERTTIYVRGKPAAVLVSLADAEKLPARPSIDGGVLR